MYIHACLHLVWGWITLNPCHTYNTWHLCGYYCVVWLCGHYNFVDRCKFIIHLYKQQQDIDSLSSKGWLNHFSSGFANDNFSQHGIWAHATYIGMRVPLLHKLAIIYAVCCLSLVVSTTLQHYEWSANFCSKFEHGISPSIYIHKYRIEVQKFI